MDYKETTFLYLLSNTKFKYLKLHILIITLVIAIIWYKIFFLKIDTPEDLIFLNDILKIIFTTATTLLAIIVALITLLFSTIRRSELNTLNKHDLLKELLFPYMYNSLLFTITSISALFFSLNKNFITKFYLFLEIGFIGSITVFIYSLVYFLLMIFGVIRIIFKLSEFEE